MKQALANGGGPKITSGESWPPIGSAAVPEYCLTEKWICHKIMLNPEAPPPISPWEGLREDNTFFLVLTGNLANVSLPITKLQMLTGHFYIWRCRKLCGMWAQPPVFYVSSLSLHVCFLFAEELQHFGGDFSFGRIKSSAFVRPPEGSADARTSIIAVSCVFWFFFCCIAVKQISN